MSDLLLRSVVELWRAYTLTQHAISESPFPYAEDWVAVHLWLFLLVAALLKAPWRPIPAVGISLEMLMNRNSSEVNYFHVSLQQVSPYIFNQFVGIVCVCVFIFFK